LQLMGRAGNRTDHLGVAGRPPPHPLSYSRPQCHEIHSRICQRILHVLWVALKTLSPQRPRCLAGSSGFANCVIECLFSFLVAYMKLLSVRVPRGRDATAVSLKRQKTEATSGSLFECCSLRTECKSQMHDFICYNNLV